MKKRVFALLLALTLCFGLLPVTASAAELPKLDTPTELEWGKQYQYDGTFEDFPGVVSWYIGSNHQSEFDIAYYNTADETEPIMVSTWYLSPDEYDMHWSSDDFVLDSASLTSGAYYFTVQALGDGINYADSDVARSETWEYVRPDAQIATPAAITWGENGAYTLSPCDDPCFGGYEVEFYVFKDKADATEADLGYAEAQFGEGDELSKTPYIHLERALSDHALSEGVGYYYAQVRALSNDITKTVTSELSPLSTAYHFTDVYENVKTALDAIDDTAAPEDIRAAVQSIENLKKAILADHGEEADGVNAKLDALETRTGVTKTVEVAEGLGDTFTQEDVKFVGAALNDLTENAGEVKLTVAPLTGDTDLVLPTLYNDTVVTKFSMDIEGLADTSALKVPVRVTLPVPGNINPDFLVILHYDSQGVPTALSGQDLYIFQEGDKTMVSFVVDHFSDFAMTELRQDDPDPVIGDRSGSMTADDGVRSLDWACTADGQVSVTTENLADGEMVLVGCYDLNGRFTGVKLLDDQNAAAQIDPNSSTVKLFWLGAAQNPLSPSVTVWGE